jgi:ABC-type phosphate transport system substrate-binding protein
MNPLPGHAGPPIEAIAIIANKSVIATSISRDDLRPIFQTKSNTWPDGTPAHPFNLADTDTLRMGFDAAVLGLDPARVARYWIDRKIRGGERPPPNVPSAAVMLKIVSKTPGAVGYVEAVAVDGSVRVLAKVIAGQMVKP